MNGGNIEEQQLTREDKEKAIDVLEQIFYQELMERSQKDSW